MPIKRGPGRPLGFKLSQETRDKISETKRGFQHSAETRKKMSETRSGLSKSLEHRKNISRTLLIRGLDVKCIQRFEDLKSNYPEQEDFFLDNEEELIFAMQDIRTEKELRDIRLYIETSVLRQNEPYQYESSSFHAAEDAMIRLIDFKLSLPTMH